MERGGRRSAGGRVMVAEMRSGQGMRTRALLLVAGQLSHNALPLRPSPPYIIFGMANG